MTESQFITYSIIIPHHNIPALLRRCLASIPQREDTEILVVDDKSADNCMEALHRLEREFSKVRFVYSRDGKGAGHARNVGLGLAKGKYVLFADADDFFTYALADVLDEYAHSTHDVVFFNANSLDTDTYAVTYRNLHLTKMINAYQSKPEKAVHELKYAFGEPWCKMVRRELIEQNNIRFSETVIHNDTRYSYLVGYYSRDVKVDNRAVYCVTDRRGSVSKRVSVDRLLARTEVFAEANLFFKEHAIRRFDERGLRPLIGFLAKGDFFHARQCIGIMRKHGMKPVAIVFRCLCYPYYLTGKSPLLLKKCITKFI